MSGTDVRNVTRHLSLHEEAPLDDGSPYVIQSIPLGTVDEVREKIARCVDAFEYRRGHWHFPPEFAEGECVLEPTGPAFADAILRAIGIDP